MIEAGSGCRMVSLLRRDFGLVGYAGEIFWFVPVLLARVSFISNEYKGEISIDYFGLVVFFAGK